MASTVISQEVEGSAASAAAVAAARAEALRAAIAELDARYAEIDAEIESATSHSDIALLEEYREELVNLHDTFWTELEALEAAAAGAGTPAAEQS